MRTSYIKDNQSSRQHSLHHKNTSAYLSPDDAKSVRPHFQRLSNLKMQEAEESESKSRRFMKYYQNASLYQINKGKDLSNKRSINSVTDSILKKQPKKPTLSELHPKLLNELNDPSTTQLPAYVRFQQQDRSNCLLRDDLKKLKSDHFKQLYDRELKKPKTMMQDVEFSNT